MLVALLVVLAILWLLGFLQTGNLDFLRVPVFRIDGAVVTLLDVLLGLAVLFVVVALPRPLAIAAGVLLIVWVLSLVGLIAIEGIPLSTLIVLVILVGLLVHVLTRGRGRVY